MGIGSARGEDRAVQAAELAISSPLLEASIDGAHGVLLSIQGGSDLGLFEINEAARLVQEAAHPEANIIFGAVIDDALGDEVRVTVIAAGFDGGAPLHRADNRALGTVQGRSAPAPAARGGRPAARPVTPPAPVERPRRRPASTDDAAVVTEHAEAPRRAGARAAAARRRARSPSTRTTTSTSRTSSSSPATRSEGRAGPSGPPLARLRWGVFAWHEDRSGVVRAVTDRSAGVSTGRYAGLNLGAHVDDDPDAVAENRRRLTERLGRPVVYMDQCHGAEVAVVDGVPDVPPSCDGLVTRSTRGGPGGARRRLRAGAARPAPAGWSPPCTPAGPGWSPASCRAPSR